MFCFEFGQHKVRFLTIELGHGFTDIRPYLKATCMVSKDPSIHIFNNNLKSMFHTITILSLLMVLCKGEG